MMKQRRSPDKASETEALLERADLEKTSSKAFLRALKDEPKADVSNNDDAPSRRS